MSDLSCDVAVIGAGTAGLAAERSARGAGARTLLIDAGFSGTTCASVGCMPSKLLIAAGDAAHGVRRAGTFGIRVAEPAIDGPAVMERVHAMRDAFVASTLRSVGELPEGVAISAHARFASPNELVLDDGRRIAARAIVIATGSRPHVPEAFVPLGDLVLTNETIFEMADLPDSVAVIGAGPLGLELAQAMARLGVATTVFDRGDAFAGLHDRALADTLQRALGAEMAIHLGVDLEMDRAGDAAVIRWSGASSGEGRFDRVLVAAGRPPALDTLDLAASGLTLDDRGTPKFDPHTMQCGDAAIFIAGDADADRPVLHEATMEGTIAGRNAARFPDVVPAPRAVSFAVMFTDPPLAMIGDTTGEGRVTGTASYDDQGRAKVEARNEGLVHLYGDPADGRIVGAAMAAPGAAHMGHLIAWAIERGETAQGLLALPFYHPTLEEGLKPALRAICKAVGAQTPDDGAPGD